VKKNESAAPGQTLGTPAAPASLFPPAPAKTETRYSGLVSSTGEHIGANHFRREDAESEASYWRRTLRQEVAVVTVEVEAAA